MRLSWATTSKTLRSLLSPLRKILGSGTNQFISEPYVVALHIVDIQYILCEQLGYQKQKCCMAGSV